MTNAPAAAGTGPGAGSSDDDEESTRKRQRTQPEEPEGGYAPVLFCLYNLTDGIAEEITGASTYLVTGLKAKEMHEAYYQLFRDGVPDCKRAQEDSVLGPMMQEWDARDKDDQDWNKRTLFEWNKDPSNPLARQLSLFMM